MEKAEVRAAERAEAAPKPPHLVKDILEYPGVRVVPSHSLKVVWKYFREFPHDILPVFRNAFSDLIEGVIYPNTVLLLKDKADDRRVGEVVNKAVSISLGATVEEAYKLLRDRRTPGAIVLDDEGKYVGIVTLRGLLEAVKQMQPKARSVNAVYSEFGAAVQRIEENRDIGEIMKKIAGGDADGAVVVNKRGLVAGVITVWDFIRSSIWLRPRREPRPIFGKGVSRGSSAEAKAPAAKAVMSTGVPIVTPRTPIEDAAQAMATLGVYVLPVVDKDGRAIGALTAFDVLKAYFEGPKEGREDLEPERPIKGAEELKPSALEPKPVKFATGVRARDILRSDVPTVSLFDSISHIRRVMVKTDAPIVAVVNEDRKIVGLISRRDMLFYLAEKSLGYWKVQKGKKLVLRENVMPGEQAKLLREEGTASDVMRVDVPKLSADASAEEIAYHMLAAGTDYVLIVDNSGEPLGVITRDDLVKVYAERGREEATVAELMSPADIVTVTPFHSVSHVVEKMKKYELDGILVVEGSDVRGAIVDNKLTLTPIEESLRGERVFIITRSGSKKGGSERLRYPKASPLTASDIMDEPPPTITANEAARAAAARVLRHGVVAVFDQQGRLIGALTGFDLVRDLARAYATSKAEIAKRVEA